uniref:uncharacterized protein LOC105353257 n=1 Tax=Fragaria vesca subsp. vesca TaxID=101020 RepID=UPI0005CA289D|nr:PREDICTED: uncharacterized protein LOC105353257 [Fragaria vesca subsp. vesca]
MDKVPSFRRKLLRDRERNLCKKANELSILCGTDVCMITFKPHNTKPETWPQERTELQKSIALSKSTRLDPKKMKLDLSFSDSYDSETRGKKLHADYNALNPEEAMAMEMQYQEGTAKHPQNELIGDDEAKLASLEVKLQAITKRIASMEANYF